MFDRMASASACVALAMIVILGAGLGFARSADAALTVPRAPQIIEIDDAAGSAVEQPAAAATAAATAGAPIAAALATSRALPPLPVIAALTNQRINDPALTPANARDVVPAVAAIGDKVLAVWYVRGTVGTQRLHAAYSEDGGATWLDGGWLPALTGDWRWNFDPCVEADPLTGKFYVASQAVDPAGNHMGVAVTTGLIPGGGGLGWTTPNIPIQTAPFTGGIYTNQVHLKFDVTNRTLHLVYRDHFDPMGALYYRSSLDGADWSFPQIILSDGTHKIGNMPRVGFGLYGPLVTYFDYAGYDGITLRSQRPLNPPSNPPSWEAPVTASAFREELTTVPGTNADYSSGASMAVDRTLWLYQNRIYAAWVEGAVFPTWPSPSGDVLDEIEPNETPAQATAVPPAAGYVQGFCFPPNTDVDWFSVSLAQGQHLVVRPASIVPFTANATVYVECFAADGVHGLGQAQFQPVHVGTGRMMITAPIAGTYYLRVTSFENDSYALSLAYSNLFTFPRDRRELYTSYSADGGGSWSTPVPLYVGGIGFDVADPTLAVGNDGRPYLFWHDFSVGSANGTVSTMRVSRSSDGGASWEAPVTLATAPSDWQPIPPNTTSIKIGWRIGAATTPPYIGELAQVPAPELDAVTNLAPRTDAITPEEWMHVLWADARDGEVNIYGTRFPTGFEVVYRTLDTTAVPGQIVGLRMVVENRNTLFPQSMTSGGVTIQRNWPVLGQSFFVNPGERWVGYPVVVTVPDTATSGTVFVQGGWSLPPNGIGMNTFIHVTSQVGVEPGGGVAGTLEFAAPSPNPAVAQTTFRMTLPAEADATLEVFDVRGALVRTLHSGRTPAGALARTWDLGDEAGRRVRPGLYLARFRVEGVGRVRRVAVIE